MQLLVSKLASASSAVRSMNFYSLPCDLLDQHVSNQHLVTSLCDMISVMFVPENSWIEPATLPFLIPPEPKPQKLNPRDVPIISRCHVTFCHNDIEFMTSPDLRRLARCKLPILLLQLLHQVLLGLHGLLGFCPQLVMLLLQLLQLLLQHLSWNTLHTTGIITNLFSHLALQRSCLLLLRRSCSELCMPFLDQGAVKHLPAHSDWSSLNSSVHEVQSRP